jgi:excisionase family DNA binding protein
MNSDVGKKLGEMLKDKLAEPLYLKITHGPDGNLIIEQVAYLRTEELAALIGVEERTIRGWVAKGQVPYHKPPGSSANLFQLGEIIKWVESRDLDNHARTKVA